MTFGHTTGSHCCYTDPSTAGFHVHHINPEPLAARELARHLMAPRAEVRLVLAR